MVILTRVDGETKIGILKRDILRIEETVWCTNIVCFSGVEIQVNETFEQVMDAYMQV